MSSYSGTYLLELKKTSSGSVCHPHCVVWTFSDWNTVLLINAYFSLWHDKANVKCCNCQ